MTKKLGKKWIYIVLVFLGLTPVLWFLGKSGYLIDGVDTNFPLDPVIWFVRRFFVWTDVFNGGSTFYSSTAGIFFHLVQVVPYMLTSNIFITQIISFIFWFSAIIFASYFFVRQLVPKNKVSQLVFVCFYAFNTYLFNTWENVKVSNLSVAVCFPLVLGILLLYKKRAISNFYLFGLSFFAGVFASGSGINPAYFFTILLAGFIFSVIFRSFRGYIIFIFGILLINTFWILPTVYYLFINSKPLVDISDIGLTNWVRDLSKNTSLSNVIRLQGAWDWYEFQDGNKNYPMYLPYVVNYANRIPFILYSYMIPLLSFISFLARKKEEGRYYILFAVFMFVGIIMGAGVHPPTGFFYALLADHVPFFSFFRSPWYIFTPFLTFANAGLISLLVSSIVARFLKVRRFIYIMVFVLLVGNFFYIYPLVTGKIFRPSRADGFYTKFPDYVWDAREWLNKRFQKNKNSVVSYPGLNIERFNWGYRGVESIIGLISDVPVIAPDFNQKNLFLEDYLQELYKQLNRQNYKTAFYMLPFIGSDTIFFKHDAAGMFSRVLDEKISKDFSLNKFGEWIFALGRDLGQLRIYSPERVFVNEGDVEDLAHLAKVIPVKSLVLNKADTVVEEIIKENKVKFQSLITGREDSGSTNIKKFSLDIPRNGIYDLIIEKDNLESNQIMAWLDGQVLNLKFREEEETIIYEPISLGKGKHVLEISFPAEPVLLRKSLVVQNAGNGKKSVFIELPQGFFDYMSKYIVRFSYRYVDGVPPIIEAVQFTPPSLLHNMNKFLDTTYAWKNEDLIVEPVAIPSKLDLFITIPEVKGEIEESISHFRDITIEKLYQPRVFAVEKNGQPEPVKIDFTRVSPVEFNAEVEPKGRGYFVVFNDNYTRDWVLKINGVAYDVTHFTANGFANGWYVSNGTGKQSLSLYYHPQDTYKVGVIISCLSVILFLGLYSRRWLKK